MAKIRISLEICRLAIAVLIGTATIPTSCAGPAKGAEGTEPTLHKLVLPKITRITILENPRGKFMDGLSDPPQKCADVFVLSEKMIRKFFSKANKVTQRDYFDVLSISSCSVTGTVQFANGDKANWSINSFQSGTIFFTDNKKNLFLFCPKCTWEPFNL